MGDGQHTDGTPCPGARCAWAGDAGHRPAPIKPPRDRCPQCGRDDNLYDLDLVQMMQRFSVQDDGEKAYNDPADDAGATPVTVGIYCRSCEWTVEWGTKGPALSANDLLLTESEFAASEQRDEDAKIAAARLEALRLMRGL